MLIGDLLAFSLWGLETNVVAIFYEYNTWKNTVVTATGVNRAQFKKIIIF